MELGRISLEAQVCPKHPHFWPTLSQQISRCYQLYLSYRYLNKTICKVKYRFRVTFSNTWLIARMHYFLVRSGDIKAPLIINWGQIQAVSTQASMHWITLIAWLRIKESHKCQIVTNYRMWMEILLMISSSNRKIRSLIIFVMYLLIMGLATCWNRSDHWTLMIYSSILPCKLVY